MSKKIDEVREVVQNRSSVDIAKVLEHFDYNVGKAIDAFVSDGGKEALSKWSEARSQLNSSHSSLISEAGKRPVKQSNRPNLNDLVASVIDQYTSTSLSSTPAVSISPSEPHKPEVLLDTINRLNTETNLNGYKVTILGVETPGANQSNSSSTSPSSVSVASSASFERPHQLPLDVPKFNKSYSNPNAKQLLEKPIKDLQRQTVQLGKVHSSIEQQVAVSSQLLNKTYQQLFSILTERKVQLERELKASSQIAISLVEQRQKKAANLKLLADNGLHLSDAQCNELRADIKHFVSERLLDEELAKINFFSTQPNEVDRIAGDLGRLGCVANVKNEYSAKRPANIEDIVSPVPSPVVVDAKPQRINKKNPKVANGDTDRDDGQGQFIEVKKPRMIFYFFFYFFIFYV